MTGADGLTADYLERYLPQRLGCESVTVTELIKFPRGSSRETWFAVLDTVSGSDRQTQKLVFRRNFPGGSVCPMPLRTEYEVYARLQRSAVPVAEVLWYEDDAGALEGQREFYVRRHIEGSWEIPHLHDPDPQYNQMRIDIAKEHIGKLALIHQCDWRALGFGDLFDVPPSKADSARTVIDSIERQLAEFQIEPFPLFHEAREWLLDNEPDPVREIPKSRTSPWTSSRTASRSGACSRRSTIMNP